MTWINWIPAISVPLILGFVGWLFRSLIQTRLTASVQHEFNEKIETVRTELRNNEESYKAELKSKENQITALRSGALTNLVNRQIIIDKRRLEAVDDLWASVISLSYIKSASAMMATVKFDVAAEMSAKDSNVQDVFKTMGSMIEKVKVDAQKSRPFVSPIAWALFSAYQAIIWHAFLQLEMLKSGINIPKLIDSTIISSLVKIALPHQTEYIDKYGTSAHYYLLEELENKILDELKKIIDGTESDQANIKQAAEILKISDRLMGEMTIIQPSQI
jgi:hypothetical protein